MYLENLVFDAADPGRLGRFWEELVGGERLTDEPDAFETRLAIADGPVLDLCFQAVPEPRAEAPARLRPVLRDRPAGCKADAREVADLEGNPCLVAAGAGPLDSGLIEAGLIETGPVAGLVLDCADPVRDAAFWAWLTGWADWPARQPALRHPSGRGPVLEFRPQRQPKQVKNRLHLDVRLDLADDAAAVAAGITHRGGREVRFGSGLPWRSYVDPSGNEFCVLPARN